MIDPKDVNWTDEEQARGVAVLEKISFCQAQGVGLPGAVYEAHIQSKKNTSTEMGLWQLVDGMPHLYLVRRPTKAEVPHEPYPGQLHVPGVTHMKRDRVKDTFERLRRREGLAFTHAREVCLPQEVVDRERGAYTLRIFVAEATGEPTNPKGQFVSLDSIPWRELVESHRRVIVPMIVGAIEAENFNY